jgi:hypothetical protein
VVTLVEPATSRSAATSDPVIAGAWAIPGVSEAPGPLVAGSDGDEWFVIDNSHTATFTFTAVKRVKKTAG